MGKNNIMGQDDEVPTILGELPNPWSKGKGMVGVNFDGNQNNGKHGSPYINPSVIGEVPNPGLHDYQKREPQAETDGHKGVNWDNTQGDNIEDEAWERQQNVFMKSDGKFKDSHNGFMYKEVDLSKHISGVGFPDEGINGNSSADCYGG